MNGATGTNSTLVTLLLIALVVARFLFRELRDQKLALRTMFVMPGLLVAVALWMLSLASGRTQSVGAIELFAGGGIAAIVLGLALGVLVSRFSTVRLGPPGTVIVRGSIQTVAIWIAALVARFAARYLLKGEGQASLFAGNAALVLLVAAALAMRRYRIMLDARRLRAQGTTSEISVV